MKRIFCALAAIAILSGAASAAPFSASDGVKFGKGTKAATATAGAATLSNHSGKITSEALTTAAGAAYTLTITNTKIAASDVVLASVAYGTATTGVPVVTRVTPGAGSVVVVVRNVDAAAALNGTIKVSFVVLKN